MNIPPTGISYAQNNEDIILRTILHNIKKGFYVDIGANHPTQHSVTKLFYENGWHGINIEPNPRLHTLILKERPKDINLNLGVANKNGTLSFRLYHSRDGLEGLSTFSEASKQENTQAVNEDNKNYSDIDVPVKKLSSILAKHAPAVIHFMKVDVEGFEYEVLASNNWKRLRPQILCIEFNHLVKDWHSILKDAKYVLIFTDGLNEYFVAAEVKEQYATKDLIERIIINCTGVIKSREYKLWQNDLNHIDKLKELSTLREAEINKLKELVNRLQELNRLTLKEQPLNTRIKRALYGLTVDWLRFKKGS